MRKDLLELKADGRQCRELGQHLNRENERMAELPGKIHPLNREITRISGRLTQLRQRIRLLSSAPTPLLRGPAGAAADIAAAVARANIEAEISAHEADLERIRFKRNRECALGYCFIAFSYGKPVSTFPENALVQVESQREELKRQLREATDNARSLSRQMDNLDC